MPSLSRALSREFTGPAEPFTVTTGDGVRLSGTRIGSMEPAVVLCHGFSGWHRKPRPVLFADALARWFTVYGFDFRGHGESTSIGMDFWRLPGNSSLKGYRPGKLKDQISYKDFTTSQNWLSLVNDIQAAKRFLDRAGLGEGWLVLFDLRKEVSWVDKLFVRDVEHAAKQIRIMGC